MPEVLRHVRMSEIMKEHAPVDYRCEKNERLDQTLRNNPRFFPSYNEARERLDELENEILDAEGEIEEEEAAIEELERELEEDLQAPEEDRMPSEERQQLLQLLQRQKTALG